MRIFEILRRQPLFLYSNLFVPEKILSAYSGRIDDISDVDANKMAIAVGPSYVINSIGRITVYTPDQMVEDIMLEHCRFDDADVVIFFETWGKREYRANQYAPVYFFIRRSGIDIDWRNGNWAEYNKGKNRQFDKRLKSLESEIHMPSDGYCIRDFIEGLREDLKPMAVVLFFDKGMMSEDEAMAELRSIYKSMNKINGMARSNFKFALTYIPFKQLGLRERYQKRLQ